LTDGTFDEFFRSIIGELGVQSQEASRQATNQNILVDQVDSRRQSVSGVSLDEEMANMIKFQHAYNAAARSLTTFDEMLDKVINGMGTVGR
jgi:flagellar hook-associated protein 1 FlgK